MKSLRFFIFLIVFLSFGVQHIDSVYECGAGKWGAQCGEMCGHCMGGGEFCQVYDGLCANGCASGYSGEKCNQTCKNDFYGPYCKEQCGSCTSNTLCNKITGHCESGCETGFQKPFCKLPCPHLTFGEDCAQTCNCTEECGCDPDTGDCIYNCDQSKTIKYLKQQERVKCTNQYKLKHIGDKYKPPDILDIPWLSILSIVFILISFVLSNFVWWYFWVRRPAPPEDKIEIDRSVRPEYINQFQDHVMIMSRFRRKIMVEEISRSDVSSYKPKKPAFQTVETDSIKEPKPKHVQERAPLDNKFLKDSPIDPGHNRRASSVDIEVTGAYKKKQSMHAKPPSDITSYKNYPKPPSDITSYRNYPKPPSDIGSQRNYPKPPSDITSQKNYPKPPSDITSQKNYPKPPSDIGSQQNYNTKRPSVSSTQRNFTKRPSDAVREREATKQRDRDKGSEIDKD